MSYFVFRILFLLKCSLLHNLFMNLYLCHVSEKCTYLIEEEDLGCCPSTCFPKETHNGVIPRGVVSPEFSLQRG